MEIQPLEYSDLNLLTDLQPAGWEIIPSFEFYTRSNYCFPLKITVENKIVGIGSSILNYHTAWLGHIIVHPDFRNQGIGKLITETLVNSVKHKKCDTIYLIATELGEPVYKKIGFETESEYLLFKNVNIKEPFTLSENIVSYTPSFKEQVLNLDSQVSSENRIFHLEPYLSEGHLYIQDNKVKGFYLPNCKEGLVMATTDAVGHELMKLRFTTKENASFPIENESSIAFMSENNYEASMKQKRMRLGKKRNWQPIHLYNRIGGNMG